MGKHCFPQLLGAALLCSSLAIPWESEAFTAGRAGRAHRSLALAHSWHVEAGQQSAWQLLCDKRHSCLKRSHLGEKKKMLKSITP